MCHWWKQRILKEEFITGGMTPKLTAALDAKKRGASILTHTKVTDFKKEKKYKVEERKVTWD